MPPRGQIPSVGQGACLPLRLGRALIHACFYIAICLPRLSRECHNRGKPAHCQSSFISRREPANCAVSHAPATWAVVPVQRHPELSPRIASLQNVTGQTPCSLASDISSGHCQFYVGANAFAAGGPVHHAGQSVKLATLSGYNPRYQKHNLWSIRAPSVFLLYKNAGAERENASCHPAVSPGTRAKSDMPLGHF